MFRLKKYQYCILAPYKSKNLKDEKKLSSVTWHEAYPCPAKKKTKKFSKKFKVEQHYNGDLIKKNPAYSNRPQIKNTGKKSDHIGHLNKGWINYDLRRYRQAFSHSENSQAAFYSGKLHQPRSLETSRFNQEVLTFSPNFSKDKQAFSTFTYLKKRIKTIGLTFFEAMELYGSTCYKKNLQNGYDNENALSKIRSNILYDLNLDKIILHSSSGKLLRTPSDCAIIDLAFSTISSQKPKLLYSRSSIAGFKLTQKALLGAMVTLRGLSKLEFYYKWFFLGAGEPYKFSLNKQNTSFFGTTKHAGADQQKRKREGFPLKKKINQNFDKTTTTLGFHFLGKRAKSFKKPQLSSTSTAIKNVFVFTELDKLDYDSFSNMVGFEIQFIKKSA